MLLSASPSPPGKSEIEIFLKRRETPGHGPAWWEYLKARGLSAPSERIDATSDAAVDAAIDEHAAARPILRLAGESGVSVKECRHTCIVGMLIVSAYATAALGFVPGSEVYLACVNPPRCSVATVSETPSPVWARRVLSICGSTGPKICMARVASSVSS
jgi:hypothetical protein